MHKIKFYPVGNGDTSQIVLSNGRRLLFDYKHTKQAEESESAEWNLYSNLKEELKEADRSHFDVVAFTHGDNDHISLSTEFFELDHAKKYQGGDRTKVNELWVPAAMITESATSEDQSEEFVIWRQEARHRLKNNYGIQVFSKPNSLDDWFQSEGIKVADRAHLITDAGKLANGFTIANDDVEFFCHSPFVKHADGKDVQRNDASLIFNVRFGDGSGAIDYLAIGDSSYEILEEIVETTKSHQNDDRLCWDLLSIPHHCSYLALSDEKGSEQTVPVAGVRELLEQGKSESFMVCSSKPIKSTRESFDQVQPPHIQAKRCYQEHLVKNKGRSFLVTMEQPNERRPKPIIFTIDGDGLSRDSNSPNVAHAIATSSPPKAGQ